MTSHTLAAFGSLVAAALLLAGCSGPATPGPTSTGGAQTPAPTSTDAQPDTSGTPAPPAGPVTCETLIDPDTLLQLQTQGWTYQESPFTAGDITIDDGLQCDWGDLENDSTANLMLFGWAPLTADESAKMQDALVAEGWTLEQTETGADVVDGFGTTYRFGDGWVIVSDVADQLPLIEIPQR